MIQSTNYNYQHRPYSHSFYNVNQNINGTNTLTAFVAPYQQNTNSSNILNAMNIQGLQNTVNINQTSPQFISNYNIGTQILNDFKLHYPNLESSSMLDTKIMQLKYQNAPEYTINFMQKLPNSTKM